MAVEVFTNNYSDELGGNEIVIEKDGTYIRLDVNDQWQLIDKLALELGCTKPQLKEGSQ